MELFTFAPTTAPPEAMTGPISTGGRSQMQVPSVAADIPLKLEILTDQYTKRLDEIFQVITAKKADSSGKIKVDTVTVKLGVEGGGKIGWFVEGRLDVALAFEVEFKVNG